MKTKIKKIPENKITETMAKEGNNEKCDGCKKNCKQYKFVKIITCLKYESI